ncbi:hypothetical protein GIB67_007090 [Kingdonia uniflora]|uniref:Glucose-methanol-choline oxidoreductase N-terminal domain-containing protein n=1 Tax=Kingdonia uniflora TaxID=39325 RepID=A0A7J7NZG8_9MAGN|nr:hypothetical protein GIB67_007090 [Kingdonia uniflora]
MVDAVDNGVVILTGCKAEKFILEKNHSMRIRKKKCVGLITSICSNKTITKRLKIKVKVMISAFEYLLTPPLMLSRELKNPNIGKNLHLHHVLMVWGYFPETLTDLPGKIFQGGIITSLHKISSHESEFDVQTVIEAPTLGLTSFGVLLPWVSGHDANKRLLKYLRTAHLFALVKDQGSGEMKQEGRISYKLDPSDKENLKMGMRRALQILVTAGATEYPDLTVTSEERILDAILLWVAHTNRLCRWQTVDAYVMSSTPDLLFGDSVIYHHRRSSFKELQYLCDGDNNGVIYFVSTSYGEH